MKAPIICAATVAEKELAAADTILGAIVTSKEWEHILSNDPRIRAATQSYEAALYENSNPDTLYDTTQMLIVAHIDAAILYGIHVANAIRAVSADSTALSRYIMERRRVSL